MNDAIVVQQTRLYTLSRAQFQKISKDKLTPVDSSTDDLSAEHLGSMSARSRNHSSIMPGNKKEDNHLLQGQSEG